ncbi:MAG TPA: CDP-diacylglycerol--serine O-phosphatidyltransferase [Oligoflexia bacterium]|nr:CDP-diacylglycerol--serine O-phosphatidyltransferase [Oligoflexia bacterium]HMP47765.1 CDP-diacylglycerol--serine O-phosphatidyltransferase [Oligoflexia bacterium]
MPRVILSERLQARAFVLPCLITVTGLFAGFLSVISTIKGNYEMAVKYIAIAIIFDGLDGRVARKLNAASPFGREFDSLCDLVAFGVAPALLIWHWLFRERLGDLGVLAVFLFVAAAATRLARFNIRTTLEPKTYFEGLPVPAAAAGLASLAYAFPVVGESNFLAVLVLIFVTLLSGLMVSTFKFTSFKRLSVKEGDNRKLLLGFSFLVATLWLFDRVALFGVMLAYIASGPVLFLKRRGALSGNDQSNVKSYEEDKELANKN